MNRIIIAAMIALLCSSRAALAQKVVSTWQGTMTLTAATYTPIIAANVTMAAGSGPLPATFGSITVINVGTTNPLQVCWFSATANSTSGCETLAAGASDSVLLDPKNAAPAPTLYSGAGTTVAVRGGN